LTSIRFYSKILKRVYQERGAEMKSVALIVISSAIFLFTGCATRDYVKQQMEPLVERMSKIEAKQKECCEAAEHAAKKCEKTFELEQHK